MAGLVNCIAPRSSTNRRALIRAACKVAVHAPCTILRRTIYPRTNLLRNYFRGLVLCTTGWLNLSGLSAERVAQFSSTGGLDPADLTQLLNALERARDDAKRVRARALRASALERASPVNRVPRFILTVKNGTVLYPRGKKGKSQWFVVIESDGRRRRSA